MAIKLEDLKVGDVYIYKHIERTILAIGNKKVFYHYSFLDEKNTGETSTYIDEFLKDCSLKPKPKKTIELVTFLTLQGDTVEVLMDSDAYRFNTKRDLKRISSRTIEVD